MKNSVKNSMNVLKRVLYRSRTTKLKSMILLMLLSGIVVSVGYFVKYAYVEYAVSRAHIILNYPEIAESKYPNGARFTYYDFICEENLQEALEIMQERGKYLNYTVDDIRDNFYIYSYLDGSAGASVSSARSEGNDFSYVANEYKITYIQPHDYKNKNIFFKFFSRDFSGEFLDVLIDVNKKKISYELGGVNGFRILSEPVTVGDYDYSEEVSIYKTKINNITAYLKYLEKKQPKFTSAKYHFTLNDLRGKYNFLISNSLDGINNFVESSGISRDVNQATNKINVNIENNRLKYNKAFSEVYMNSFAMDNYDQTFTENLINVIQNEDYGLYQARPKTAFDTVSRQKYDADERTAEYDTKINIFTKELGIYQNVITTPEEHARLIEKCNVLIKNFEEEYESLTTVANEIIAEYYNSVNEGFITSKVTHKGLISKTLIVKMGIMFVIGCVFAFVIAVFVLSAKDNIEVKRRKNLIKSIKSDNQKEGA